MKLLRSEAAAKATADLPDDDEQPSQEKRPTHEVETELVIKNQMLHHHASRVLSAERGLKAEITNRLVEPRRVGVRVTEKGVLRVPSGPLNRSLRDSFDGGGWTFEATIEDGVIYGQQKERSQIGGFDFARYDETANLIRLWDVCFGRRPTRDGEFKWHEFLERHELEKLGNRLDARLRSGQSATPASRPTILGEFQFGNWGLLYRDLLKVVAADQQIGIDLFIYVTATESLSRALSSNTVRFDDSKRKGLEAFASLIRVPVWLIGLDFPPGFATLPRTEIGHRDAPQGDQE
jgi:hypothetical protein